MAETSKALLTLTREMNSDPFTARTSGIANPDIMVSYSYYGYSIKYLKHTADVFKYSGFHVRWTLRLRPVTNSRLIILYLPHGSFAFVASMQPLNCLWHVRVLRWCPFDDVDALGLARFFHDFCGDGPYFTVPNIRHVPIWVSAVLEY